MVSYATKNMCVMNFNLHWLFFFGHSDPTYFSSISYLFFISISAYFWWCLSLEKLEKKGSGENIVLQEYRLNVVEVMISQSTRFNLVIVVQSFDIVCRWLLPFFWNQAIHANVCCRNTSLFYLLDDVWKKRIWFWFAPLFFFIFRSNM